MSRTTLIECQPRRPDGTVEMLRLVDRSPRAAAYLGAQWLPLVTELPGFEIAIGFDGQRFGAQPSPQIGALAFALAPEIRAAASWVWRDAAVTIRQAAWPLDGSNPADGAFATVWTGNAASISVDGGVARVELLDKGQLLRVPVAPLRFGSTGIALLDAAAAARDRQAGAVVPVAFGRVLTLPGLLVDRLNNVWLFAAQPAASVEAFYDGGVPFAPGTQRANLAALQTNAPAGGTVDWCLNADGLLLARPADRPVYPFTCDATFGVAGLGDVATTIVGGRLPFAGGVVAALNALGLGPCGLYIDDEATVAEALDRLLAGLGLFWKVRADGSIDARRLAWGAPAASFAAWQRHAPRRQQIVLPTARRQLGFARNNRLHGDSEIARILLAENLSYADGTPIEDLKPAAPGADPTRDVLPDLNTGAWGPGPILKGEIKIVAGSSWVAIVDHTAEAANAPPNAGFWKLLAERGEDGAQGPTGVSAPPVRALPTGSAQFDPLRLTNGQTLTVEAQLFLNTGGTAGTCSIEVQISLAGANSWSVMTGGGDSDNLPTSEPIELQVPGATFTNTSGETRLYDVRLVSVRQGRTINQPLSFMRVI